MSESLEKTLAAAKAIFDSWSPAKQARHRAAQRQSWVRGEMAMGSDKDEEYWKREHLQK